MSDKVNKQNHAGGFAREKKPLAQSRIGLFVGIFSAILVVVTGIISYGKIIQLALDEAYKEYQYEANQFRNYIESLSDQPDTVAIENVRSYYESLDSKLAGEYICVVDEQGKLVLHTAEPATEGNSVGENLILDDNGHALGNLQLLVVEHRGFVGNYKSSTGQSQVAAFDFSPARNWLIGVHRSKDAFSKEIRHNYNWFLYLFILLGLLVIPSSYLIVYMAAKRLTIRQVQQQQDLIRAKERAEESDRMKSAFVANISHDIRTPLNAILGFSELIMDQELTREEQEKYYSIIQSGSDQLTAIVQNLINISIIESGELKPSKEELDLLPLFESCFRQFNDLNKNPKLNFIFQGGADQKVFADKSFLNQVLNNLIGNAIKYTEEGAIQVGYKVIGDEAIGFVQDTGVGIPKELGDLVFERFHRVGNHRKIVSGSGLGLSICKALVQANGGRIWYESEVGVGTSFYFSLPIPSK